MSFANLRAMAITLAALIATPSASAHNFAERWKALYPASNPAILDTPNMEARSGRAEARSTAQQRRIEGQRRWSKRGTRWRYVYMRRRR